MAEPQKTGSLWEWITEKPAPTPEQTLEEFRQKMAAEVNANEQEKAVKRADHDAKNPTETITRMGDKVTVERNHGAQMENLSIWHKYGPGEIKEACTYR